MAILVEGTQNAKELLETWTALESWLNKRQANSFHFHHWQLAETVSIQQNDTLRKVNQRVAHKDLSKHFNCRIREDEKWQHAGIWLGLWEKKEKMVLLEYKINICYLFFPESSKVLIKKSVMFRPVKSSRVSVVFCTLCQRQQATTVNNNFRPFFFPYMFSKEHLVIREHHGTLFISLTHIQPSCVLINVYL